MTLLCFIDVETTGIVRADLPHGHAHIWEIGLILRDLDPDPADPGAGRDAEWAWHVRPDLSGADPIALRIGGYYERCEVDGEPPGSVALYHHPDWAKDTPAGAWDLARKLAVMLDGAHLIGANVGSFDAQHLDCFLREHGQILTADYHCADIGSMARGWALARGVRDVPFPLKATGAARLVGVDPGRYATHTAMDDARMVRDIYDAMTGGAS